ncbi:hypothetical protein EV356DRAFT_96723 [Viridothelium virens]|uniref:Histone-lysine N-methyltransferase SET9 n=1 Tax=Viridothelium virens TaxID=1048519 RepID=A0A6A6HCF8_VIRVR|nr:hypothetical protein EV356DRAFT_96723 [Viridothelium virens]
MALEVALPKSKALTLSSLAKHDDIITDALLDRVYYWTTIRKNRAKYMSMRGIRDDEIANILRKTVVLEKDPPKATQQILDLKGMKNYLQSLDSDTEREHFTRHLRKYVSMYMPDCPFEINTTNRYTITNFEAAATARKQIKKGDVIKYLSGIQVPMTKEEEKNLDLTRRDFSIVMSSRKKTPSLFLGPARFANHDCNANARLSTRGSNGMQIMAVRDIQVDEEITVTYGQDYFGEDNSECLCGTCEKLLRNGWDPHKKEEDSENEGRDESDAEEVEQEEDNAQESPYGFRLKRKYALEPGSESSEDSDQTSKKQKSSTPETVSTPILNLPDQQTAEPPIKMERTSSNFSNSPLPSASTTASQDIPLLSPHRRAMQIYSKHSRYSNSTIDTDAHDSARDSSVDGAASNSTDATSPSIFDEAPRDSPPVIKEGQATTQEKAIVEPESQDADSVLTDLSSNCEFDDSTKTIIKRRRTRYQSTIRPRSSSAPLGSARSPNPSGNSGVENVEEGEPTNKRRPGDYVNTPALLSLAYSRWNICTNDSYAGSTLHFPPATNASSVMPFPSTKSKVTQPSQHPSQISVTSYASIENGCQRPFVQQDGYLTRASCPRCERHSMLYGYAWPKTDKEGKKDEEERITDHRTVHRFLSPESERRKRCGLPMRRREDEEDEGDAREQTKKATKGKGKEKSKSQSKDVTRIVKGRKVDKNKEKEKNKATDKAIKEIMRRIFGKGSKQNSHGHRIGRPPKGKSATTRKIGMPTEEHLQEEKPVFTKSGREVTKKGMQKPKKEEENRYKPSPWKGWVIVDD